MTSAVTVQVRKELRALLPWWAMAMVACAAMTLMARQSVRFPGFRFEGAIWAVATYVVAALAIGALSIGHELAHRTLPALLVQPVRRGRVLAIKVFVWGLALLTLGLLADWLFIDRLLRPHSRQLLLWGPIVAGIGLAPLLTLLTRRALGGAVFAMTIPGAIFAVGNIFYPERSDATATNLTWYATLVLSAAGLLLLFRQFGRLEIAGDGAVRSPSARRAMAAEGAGRPAPRHWIGLVVRKELRLQQMTFAVSALYVLACLASAVAQRLNPDYMGATFYALSGLHAVFIALLAGALASAEERQLGTLGVQLLTPQAAWTQWTIKSGTAVALALALGVGLPLLLMWTSPANRSGFSSEIVIWSLLLTSLGLYVSALSTSSLWALLASFPAIGLALLIGFVALWPMGYVTSHWIRPMAVRVASATSASGHTASIRSVEEPVAVLLVIGLGCLAIVFAGRNHRSLDRSVRSVAGQVLWLAAYAAVAVIILQTFSEIAIAARLG